METAVSTLRRAGSSAVSIPAAGALVAVVGLSLLLRTHNLLVFPLWWDESIYLKWATDIWTERTRMALLIPIADDGKQPLFMWLAGGAMQLIGDPLLAGRLVSVLAGTASTVGVYLAGRRLLGRQTGLVAALFYAVAPFTLLFDRMALADALLNAAGVWAFCAAILAATRARGRRDIGLFGIALGLCLGTALWTKMPALFMLAYPVLCVMLLGSRNEWRLPAGAVALGYAVFGLFALALALMPEASKLIEKTSSFTVSSDRLLSLPVDIWWSHVATYGQWVTAYLPAPLWWLVPPATIWGLAVRPRTTLLLLGCWLAFSLPTVLTARKLYESRYLMPGVLFLLLLAADLVVAAWRRADRLCRQWRLGVGPRRLVIWGAAPLLLLATLIPSLVFDYRLLASPESAGFTDGDREQYVTGWPSGYGFKEALQLVKQRTAELTQDGRQPVILLTDNFHGLPLDGVKVYMRGAPQVFHYIDNHLYRDAEGFLAAWRPHRVPIVVFGNLGTDDLESFERFVPQAKRIGYFPKPGGRYSFRVYEIAVSDLGP